MAYPKFVLDANVLQFTTGIQFPVEKPIEKIQAQDRTACGSLEVEKLGPNLNTRRIHFKNLPQADYEALRNWYDNIADGAVNPFTFYDEEGKPWTVIITTPKIRFPQTWHHRYTVTLDLEIVG